MAINFSSHLEIQIQKAVLVMAWIHTQNQ